MPILCLHHVTTLSLIYEKMLQLETVRANDCSEAVTNKV
jgi:hypothetical protein